MLARLTMLGGVALAAAALVGCGGSDTPEAAEAGPKSVAAGGTAVVDRLTWRVVGTKQTRRIAPPGGLAYSSQNGVYLIVELALKNASGGAARAVGEYVALLGGDGKRYRLDEDGSSAYHLTLGPHRHDPALYEPTRPDPVFGFFDVPTGTARSASVTFDVPPAALRGARLEVEPPGAEVTRFALGL